MIATSDQQSDPRIVAECIPAELKQLPRWTCWKYEPNPGGGKDKKVPVNPYTGRNASPTDSATWGPLDMALGHLKGDPSLAGVMFALGDDMGFVGVDLDGCRNNDGELTPDARALVESFDSYTEVSPSGKGVKILIRGKKPGGSCRKKGVHGCHEIEIYEEKRLFTVTGRRFDWVSPEINDRQAELDDLYTEIFPAKPKRTVSLQRATDGFTGDDTALLEKARKAANGTKFTQLYDAGDTTPYGGDDSSADLALVSMIAFWTGPDPDRIDRIFRGSALMREKWDTPRGQSTYGRQTIDKALEEMTEFYGQKSVVVRTAVDGSSPPEVVLDTVEKRVADEVIARLAHDPDIFRRGGKLVRVQMLDEENPPRPSIVQITRSWLREWISQNCLLLTNTPNGEKPAHPPKYLPEAILGRGTWADIRPLVAISTAPLLRPDGTIHQVAGYDSVTRVFYAPTASFPSIPEDATLDDASGALETLRAPFADFPFASGADEAAYLSSIITLVVRTAFTGPAPLFLITANVPGAGKSLLAQAAAEISLGHGVPTSSFCSESEECRKQITTLAKLGESMVILDNLQGALGNASLDRALTATYWRDRELRTNDEISAPLTMCWFATGNNTELAADTHRRVVVCRLDLLSEHPEDREGFKHPDLLAYIRANRTKLFAAAMTLIVAYIRAGRPPVGLKPFGSFENWNDLIPASLVWVGMPDPRLTQREIGVAVNPVKEALAVLLPALVAHPKTKDGFVASDVLGWLYQDDNEQTRNLRQAIEALAGGSAQKQVQPRDLGKRLRSVRRCPADGLYLDHASEGRSKAGIRWIVRRVEDK